MEVYIGAVAAGLAATLTPCVLPLYPGFLAYLTGAPADSPRPTGAVMALAPHRVPPAVAALAVWAGVIAGMIAIGALLALFAAPIGDFNRIVLPIADAALIALGIVLLVGINPFARLPQPSPTLFGGHGPIVGAFLYGLAFAPIAVPCSGPFLVGVFAYSLTIADAVGRLAFFVAFGIGFGLPLFLLGIVGQVRGASLARSFGAHERLIQILMGIGLVAVGAWDLSVNLPLILG